MYTVLLQALFIYFILQFIRDNLFVTLNSQLSIAQGVANLQIFVHTFRFILTLSCDTQFL